MDTLDSLTTEINERCGQLVPIGQDEYVNCTQEFRNNLATLDALKFSEMTIETKLAYVASLYTYIQDLMMIEANRKIKIAKKEHTNFFGRPKSTLPNAVEGVKSLLKLQIDQSTARLKEVVDYLKAEESPELKPELKTKSKNMAIDNRFSFSEDGIGNVMREFGYIPFIISQKLNIGYYEYFPLDEYLFEYNGRLDITVVTKYKSAQELQEEFTAEIARLKSVGYDNQIDPLASSHNALAQCKVPHYRPEF